MSRLAAFTAFDLRTLVGNRRQVLVAVLFVIAAAALSPLPVIAAPAAGLMVALSASYPFATDERGRLDTLYAAMALQRRTVVLGRHVSLVAAALVLVLFACATSIAAALVRGLPPRPELVVGMGLGSLVIAVVALCLQLPLFFALGFTRARPLVAVTTVIALVAALAASRLTEGTASVLTTISAHATTAAVIGGVACALLLVASAALSAHTYRRRALRRPPPRRPDAVPRPRSRSRSPP